MTWTGPKDVRNNNVLNKPLGSAKAARSVIMQLFLKTSGKMRSVVVAVMLLTLASCTFFRAPGRDDCDKILTREEMTDILTDIYLYETFAREFRSLEPAYRDSAKYHYVGIFQYYDIESAVFQEALDCYLLDQREMNAIHEEILNRLSIMESEVQQVEEDPLEDYVPDIPLSSPPDTL